MVLFAGAALAVILFSTWSFIDRGYTVCDQSVKVWVPIFAMGHLEMFRSWALIRHMRQHMFRTHPQLPVKSVVYLVREHKHSGHGRWHLQEDVEKDLEIAKDARKVHSRPESLVIFNGAWNGKTATLEQQYRIFNSAVVAFGPHGTGFSNVIWMPCAGVGVLVLEILCFYWDVFLGFRFSGRVSPYSQSVSQTVSRSVVPKSSGQSVVCPQRSGQSVSRSANRAVSQSVIWSSKEERSVSQSVNQSVSRSVSPVSRSVRQQGDQSVSQSVSRSVSQSCSVVQS